MLDKKRHELTHSINSGFTAPIEDGAAGSAKPHLSERVFLGNK